MLRGLIDRVDRHMPERILTLSIEALGIEPISVYCLRNFTKLFDRATPFYLVEIPFR